MSLGNTPRKEINFFVEANRSFAFAVAFIKPDGTLYGLTSQSARLVISDVVNTLASIIDQTHSWMQFNLQAQDLVLEPGVYPYDLTLTPLSGYTVPLFKGTFEVGSNVDLDTSNVYTGLVVEPTITITMDGLAVVNVTEQG